MRAIRVVFWFVLAIGWSGEVVAQAVAGGKVSSVEAFVERFAPELKIEWSEKARKRARESSGVWFSRGLTVPPGEKLPFLRRLLVSHRLYLQEHGASYRVRPMGWRLPSGVEPAVVPLERLPTVEWDVVRCVVAIEHGRALERLPHVQRLLPPLLGGSAASVASGGQAVAITGYPSDVALAARVLREFDVPRRPRLFSATNLHRELKMLEQALDRLGVALEEGAPEEGRKEGTKGGAKR